MNQEIGATDFYVPLPETTETLKFNKLSKSDQVKAITLGMRFLSLGNQQLQMWDNSQWEGRMEKLKSQKQDTIDTLQEKLQAESLKTQKLIERQQAELNTNIECVRNRTESKFLSEIASLNGNVERLENKIQNQENEKSNLYQSIHNDFDNKILSKEEHWETRIR